MSLVNKQPITAPKANASALEAAFAAALEKVQPAHPFALAVSGGGDSVALMHLVSRWARTKNIKPEQIFVLIVDHGFRPEAAQEVDQVRLWATSLGFGFQNFKWDATKPSSRLQEKARAARYQLMEDWCAANGVADLMLAHTSSDQNETVAMRLLKGSGTKGLAGMQVERIAGQGLRLLRPLLNVSGSDLRQWLRAQDIPWLEDPSNQNASFERVRARKALDGTLDGTGILAQGLSGLSEDAAHARDAMEKAADDLLIDGVELCPGPWARIDLGVMRSAPRAIGTMGLSRMILALGGGTYQPPQAPLEDLLDQSLQTGFKAGTLGGCILAGDGTTHLLLGREGRNITSLSLTGGQEDVWDHRVRIRLNGASGARISAFGEGNMDQWSPQDRKKIKEFVPYALRAGAMVVEFDDGRKAIPFAGIGDWTGIEAHFEGFQPFGPQNLGPV